METKNLQTGDIILFGGSKGIMGRLIRFFDNAEWTHIGIYVEVQGLPFVLDMWKYGMELVPLRKRTSVYPKKKVLRPNTNKVYINYEVDKLLNLYANEHIKYDYWLLPRIAIAKKLGIDFFAWGREESFICSELVQIYLQKLVSFSFIKLITPEDFVRNGGIKNIVTEIDYE